MNLVWDRPEGRAAAVVALAHGAGGDHTDALLSAMARLLPSHGIAGARFDFPYRSAGRRVPGNQKQSEDHYRTVVEAIRSEGGPVFAGGKSYGGRMASHIAAEGTELDGLVLLSYPLHAPGRPDRLRDEHLAQVRCPMLFVRGSRDPFSRPDLMNAVVDRLPSATLHEVDGGDHSLKVKGRVAADVYAEVAVRVSEFVFSAGATTRESERGGRVRP